MSQKIIHSMGFMRGLDTDIHYKAPLKGGRPSAQPSHAKVIAEVIDDFYSDHLTAHDHWPLLDEVAAMLIKEGIVT